MPGSVGALKNDGKVAKDRSKAKSRSAPPTRAPSSSSLSASVSSSPNSPAAPVSVSPLSGAVDTNTGKRFTADSHLGTGPPRRRSSRTRHSCDFKAPSSQQHKYQYQYQLQGHPAFVISPLVPLSAPTATSISACTSSSPISPSTPSTPFTTDKETTNPDAIMSDGEYVVPENERPRRAVSSPQLVRTGGGGTRARSDSASSSASLTATEENYARLRGSSGASRGYGHGHGNGYASVHGYGHAYGYHPPHAHMPTSASASRFPPATAYPPSYWTFAAAAAAGQHISPTSPDSSEAATSPSEEYDDEDDDDSNSDEADQEQDDLIFVSRASSATSVGSSHLRNRGGSGSGVNINAKRRRSTGDAQQMGQRFVTTARGQPCAGETETELDEIPIRLPTSRNVKSRPVVPLLIDDILVPFLFQVTRFLSIVPATFGTLYNMYLVFRPPAGGKISSVDYVVCALWAILTGFQCLFLTTGLLSRWKAYYTTISTLIRLLALQGICWPATHFTLVLFDHTKRPLACWALIGTTTCLSRSVQLWVTSNLYMPPEATGSNSHAPNLSHLSNLTSGGKVLRSEGRLGPRRWDWGEVMVKCALPAGMLYFITAWAMVLKQDPFFADVDAVK